MHSQDMSTHSKETTKSSINWKQRFLISNDILFRSHQCHQFHIYDIPKNIKTAVQNIPISSDTMCCCAQARLTLLSRRLSFCFNGILLVDTIIKIHVWQ